jgi:Fanconi-associated nuclease 1
MLGYEAALRAAAALDAALLAGDAAGAEAAAAPAVAALAGPGHRAPAHPAASLAAHTTSGSGGGGEGEGEAGPPGGFPHPAAPFSAPHLHALIATVAASLHERAGRWGEAATLLRALLGGAHAPGRRGRWAGRLVTDLAHAGRQTEALEAGEAALADGRIAWGARLGLQRAVLRLGRPPVRWREPAWAGEARREPAAVARLAAPPPARPPRQGAKSAFAAAGAGGGGPASVSVEALALRHYASPAGGGWPRGEHTEGGVWGALFAVLVGCPPAPGRPPHLDWGGPAFYPPRAAAIEAALAAVAAGGAPAAVLRAWAARGEGRQGAAAPALFAPDAAHGWARFDGPTLASLAGAMGGPGLAAILEQMAHGRSGGLPDLVLWRDGGGPPPEVGRRVRGGGQEEEEARLRCKLVEVKGPNDRLSDTQRAWLAVLEDAGVAVEVLQVVVEGKGTRTQRQRSGERDDNSA